MAISNEAVEAAGKGMWEARPMERVYEEGSPDYGAAKPWADIKQYQRDRYMTLARAALSAAASSLMHQAWEEGHDAGFTYGAFQGRVQEAENPYKDASDAVWGTDLWGQISPERSERDARSLAARTGAGLYFKAAGQWTKAEP